MVERGLGSAAAEIVLGLDLAFLRVAALVGGFIHILFYYIVNKASELMSHYSINFQLLLPKPLLLRLDLFPFLLAYSIIGYFLYEYYDD